MYELSIRKGEMDYPGGKSNVVYYGSSGSLRKRLTAYFKGYGHTEKIRNFIEHNRLNVRTKACAHHRQAEAALIHEFEKKMGALPLLDSVRPKMT